MDITDPRVKYVKHVGPTVRRVYWNIGNICPYSCSYCPKDYHRGDIPFHSTEIIQSTLKKLPRCVVTFGGGEPTYHPDFAKILKEKPEHIYIGMSSNLSRPYSFWEDIIDDVFTILATYHIEHTILNRFIKTAEYIYSEKKTKGQINLVMLPSHWDKCVDVYQALRSKNLPVSVKPILNTIDPTESSNVGVIPDYSQEQLNWMTEHNNDAPNFIGLYDTNGVEVGRTSAWGLLSSKQSFKGWKCYTPMYYIYINSRGEIFDQTCDQRSKIGSLESGFDIPTDPKICRLETCWCMSDIIQKKEKV